MIYMMFHLVWNKCSGIHKRWHGLCIHNFIPAWTIIIHHLIEKYVYVCKRFKKPLNNNVLFRKICLETAVRFIYGRYGCRFRFDDADTVLKDGRVIFKIYFKKMFQSFVLIVMISNKGLKWYYSVIDYHDFALIAYNLNHIYV